MKKSERLEYHKERREKGLRETMAQSMR